MKVSFLVGLDFKFGDISNQNIKATNTMNDANLLVFSLGYNILRIKEGKAGLAYLI